MVLQISNIIIKQQSLLCNLLMYFIIYASIYIGVTFKTRSHRHRVSEHGQNDLAHRTTSYFTCMAIFGDKGYQMKKEKLKYIKLSDKVAK